MKDYEQILEQLNFLMPEAPRVAHYEADRWKSFIKKFPIGTRVSHSDYIGITRDGGYYDDPTFETVFVNIDGGGSGGWSIDQIKKI